MNTKPYIGITGIENSNQLEGILKTYHSKKEGISHLLMIGGIVSYKTLINVKDKPIVLMQDEVRNIYNELKNQSCEDVLFALHYSTKPLKEVKQELQEKAKQVVNLTLHQQISSLVEKLYCDYEKTKPHFQIGVQINVEWPKPEDIRQLKTNYPKLKVVLKIIPPVSDFSSLKEKIKNYNADYILIDPSRGMGIELNITEAVSIYNTIKDCSVMIGFAGGFSPENVRRIVTSLKENLGRNDFCIDAQTGLRSGEYLDMEKVKKYLEGALEAFQEHP